MTVELLPIGYACNLRCRYCYQKYLPRLPEVYDLNKMLEIALRLGTEFSVFGGEPLLVPLQDLERIWKIGHERFGRNGIQTNAVLVTDEHVCAFKKFNVHIGVSLDGPGVLNSPRSNVGLTQASLGNFYRLLKEKIPCSLITTLHKENAIGPLLDNLCTWLRELGSLGLRSMRIHLLERDSCEDLVLSDEEAFKALLQVRSTCVEANISLDIFRDIARLLRGDDRGGVTCIWNGCDPLTTPAVQHIDGKGHLRNCGRVNKKGRSWVKAGEYSAVRQLLLWETPQEDNGCAGCRYFIFCKGFCPGFAEDWRERPRECSLLYRLFELVEKELRLLGETVVPARLDFSQIQEAMLTGWRQGRQMQVFQAIEEMGQGRRQAAVLDRTGHGDIPHGDSYADHWDR
jgi:uncharacterized protein